MHFSKIVTVVTAGLSVMCPHFALAGKDGKGGKGSKGRNGRKGRPGKRWLQSAE